MILTRPWNNHREVKTISQPSERADCRSHRLERQEKLCAEQFFMAAKMFGSRMCRSQKSKNPLTQSFDLPSRAFVARTYGRTEVYSPWKSRLQWDTNTAAM